MIYPDQFVLIFPYALLVCLLCFLVGYVCGCRDKEKSLAEEAKRKELERKTPSFGDIMRYGTRPPAGAAVWDENGEAKKR
jgi:hypothetical protein